MEQSFASITSDIINYNKNILELLNKLETITNSAQSSVSVSFSDGKTDILYNIPTIGYLTSEIQRLDSSLKSIYSIDGNESYIQTSNSNLFRKIILVNLNKEPKNISSLNQITSFVKSNNSFFDGLLDPLLSVSISLKDKIGTEIRKVLVRRYIIDFDKDVNGNYTTAATNAISSFDSFYKSKVNIGYNDFINWYKTIGGVYNPNEPYYDETLLDVSPNRLLYNGYFSVKQVQVDDINKKIWYYLDKLSYYNNIDGSTLTLKVDDELLLNKEFSNSRYKVVEISYANTLPMVRFQQVEGIEEIPVLTSALKINSVIDYTQTVNVSIGYDERCIIFIKAFDTNSNILSSDWSLGTGFYTNDLNLTSGDSENGKNMTIFYSETVNDYGKVLSDLVSRKKPVALGVKPNAPILTDTNFKVVQINKHVTDSVDIKELNKKYSYQKQLQSEIKQLTTTINDRKKIDGVGTADISKIINLRDAKNLTYQTVIGETLNISKTISKIDAPIYHVRGFWNFPSIIKEQEIVKFQIQYKSISSDLSENTNLTIKLDDSNAIYSNWTTINSDVRKRIYNKSANTFTWEIQDVSDADTPNINQLDIPIKKGETLLIRIKSISEVGFPDSILESDWSNTIEVKFPDNLSNVLDDSEFILKAATQEELVVNMKNELQEVITHVDDGVTIGNTVFLHKTDKILSGFKDANSIDMSLFDFLKQLTNEIATLKEQINKTLGILTVSIFRGNVETIINSDVENTFTIECEDYLTKYVGDANGKSGRIYDNTIYTIKDFSLRIKNSSVDSPLSLLTNRNNTYNGFYSSDVPQNFWVNERDELQFINSTGKTNCQINNQFLWQVNYVEKTETTIVKTSADIKNDFISMNDNSLVGVLSSIEYNLGYNTNTLLSFNSYNNSLIDYDKWCEKTPSIVSNNKLLTTIHPVVQNLEYLIDRSSEMNKIVKPQDYITIPINIYFKMNSINPNSGDGLNYDYINLNNVTTSVRHVKRIKFYLENKAENKAFIFTIKFNINRNKVSVGRFISEPSLYQPSGDVFAIAKK